MKRAGDVNILEEMTKVLDIEIDGLRSVRANLTQDFVTAVEIIAACTGQVLVTGVGKSGIVANKIAATFRSTGTPATFLHAGEALHGDIGIVRAGDVALAVGKTGETSELNSLLRVLRKNGVRIISLTSNGNSSMAGLSDVVLDLKISREACPLNLAPTTSTTAALAVGDAMAVALMKLKQISAEDFAQRHPGGQLGARLLLSVRDVMREGDHNPIIDASHSVKEMLVRITAFRVGGISVVGPDGRLLGLITDYDIRKVLESDRDIFSMSIAEIMNPSPEWIDENVKAADALEMMRNRSKPTALLPVLNRDHQVVGMIHLHDLVSAGL
jgi:arabinose-5-phosphate isomerase